jgi:hypothetical protein
VKKVGQAARGIGREARGEPVKLTEADIVR